ncbi:hypothetical protein D3C78_1786730 [compost metagenome]
MAHRFMQQDARPACAQHHRHITGWGCNGRKVNQCHAHRFFGVGVGTDFAIGDFQEIVIAETATAAAGTAFTLAVLLHQYADRQAH